MQVFQHDDQWLPSGEALEQLVDRLEEMACIAASGASGERRQVGRLRKLRQEPTQLRPPARLERVEELPILQHLPGPERVHPRREGQNLLGLVASANQHACLPPPGCRRHQLRRQAALPDTRLPNHDDKPPAAG